MLTHTVFTREGFSFATDFFYQELFGVPSFPNENIGLWELEFCNFEQRDSIGVFNESTVQIRLKKLPSESLVKKINAKNVNWGPKSVSFKDPSSNNIFLYVK